jgi:hypothetical protein
MIVRLVLPFLLVLLSNITRHIGTSEVVGDCRGCGVVLQALKDAQNLKVGMARADIENHGFAVGGGMAFRDHTIYEYKGCNYIKVEINFNIDPAVSGPASPKDKISKISGLEIDYPAKD